MPQSFGRVLLHVVFSTKERRSYLQRDEEFRELCLRHELEVDER